MIIGYIFWVHIFQFFQWLFCLRFKAYAPTMYEYFILIIQYFILRNIKLIILLRYFSSSIRLSKQFLKHKMCSFFFWELWVKELAHFVDEWYMVLIHKSEKTTCKSESFHWIISSNTLMATTFSSVSHLRSVFYASIAPKTRPSLPGHSPHSLLPLR